MLATETNIGRNCYACKALESPPSYSFFGQWSRVELCSGNSITGEVKHISQDAVTIGRTGDYGYRETKVPIDYIVSIERPRGTVWTGVGVLVLGLTATLIYIASTIEMN